MGGTDAAGFIHQENCVCSLDGGCDALCVMVSVLKEHHAYGCFHTGQVVVPETFQLQ